MKKTSLGKYISRNIAGIALGGVLALAPYGCATTGEQTGSYGDYGKLKPDAEVTANFEGYKLKSDHKYFTAESDEGETTAILGLHEDYELGNRMLWEELDSKDLEGMVQGMKNSASENAIPIRGANIYDKDGNDIGDWYSTTTETLIKLKNGKTFIIYAPTSNSGGGGAGGGGGGAGSGGQ